MQDWKNAQLGLQQAETELQDACQEKALLEEALANPNHNLYTVPKRYELCFNAFCICKLITCLIMTYLIV